MIMSFYIMIIVKFPNFIQRILKNSEENFYHVQQGCKNCGYGGNLHRHASYQRTIICKSITTRITIQRVICPDCGKTHALILRSNPLFSTHCRNNTKFIGTN